MDLKFALFFLVLVSSSLASSLTERLLRRREEIPCNREAVEALRRMGLHVDHIRCFSENKARSFGFQRDDISKTKVISKRGTCCGPDCKWMIEKAGVDPSTVSCPNTDSS